MVTMNIEDVRRSVLALKSEGRPPTIRAVRAQLGGGSMTDLTRLVADVMRESALQEMATLDLPIEVRERLDTLAGCIWQHANLAADGRIRAIETECSAKIAGAEQREQDVALVADEAEAQLQRFHSEMGDAQRAVAVLKERVASLQASLASRNAEVSTLKEAVATLQEEAHSSREEARLAYGRIDAILASITHQSGTQSTSTRADAKMDGQSTTTHFERIISHLSGHSDPLSAGDIIGQLGLHDAFSTKALYKMLKRKAAMGVLVSCSGGKFCSVQHQEPACE